MIRKIHIPGIYQELEYHNFKAEKYITLLTAKYITREKYNEQLFERSLEAFHTEKNYNIQVVEKDGIFRYIGYQDEVELIIYICISGKNFGKIYAKSVKQFSEKCTDKKNIGKMYVNELN